MDKFLVKITWFGRSYFQVMDENEIGRVCEQHRQQNYFVLKVIAPTVPLQPEA